MHTFLLLILSQIKYSVYRIFGLTISTIRYINYSTPIKENNIYFSKQQQLKYRTLILSKMRKYFYNFKSFFVRQHEAKNEIIVSVHNIVYVL